MPLFEAIILAVLAASTPLLIAAAGELVTERAGVLNLGVEGMMIMGAACGFVGAYMTGSTLIGAVCGVVAGMLMSMMFARADALSCGQPGGDRSGADHSGCGFVRPDRRGLRRRAHCCRAVARPAGADQPACLSGASCSARMPSFMARWCWSSRSGGSCIGRGAGWFCARLATSTSRPTRWAIRCCGIRLLAVMFGGACAGLAGRLPVARLYAVFRVGHDGRARLDRARFGRVRVVAAGAAPDRGLSVRRGDDPAACMRRARVWHSAAAR